jgi:hypothetical protein
MMRLKEGFLSIRCGAGSDSTPRVVSIRNQRRLTRLARAHDLARVVRAEETDFLITAQKSYVRVRKTKF